MVARNNSAENALLVSRSAANSEFREAVRLFVGRGRRYSAKQVEIGTGIKARMVESFMAPVDSTDFRKPDLEEFLTLAAFFGAEFTSEVVKLSRQGAFDLPEGDVPPGEIAADNAEDNAVVTRAAKDGVFDKAERPDLKVVGEHMIERGQRLVKIGLAA